MAERPKRRKYKDNPYTLSYCEEKNIYIISFRDVERHLQNIEVSKEIYQAFDRFELDDIKELNEYDRHIEHSEVFENNLTEKAMDKPMLVDEIVENEVINEELKKAIDSLSDIQRRRIKMYYFENMNLREIAAKENCAIMSVKDSINVGLKKLKEILKKFKD